MSLKILQLRRVSWNILGGPALEKKVKYLSEKAKTGSLIISTFQAGHAMEWKMVWNGRGILVWNIRDAQNGMEDRLLYYIYSSGVARNFKRGGA